MMPLVLSILVLLAIGYLAIAFSVLAIAAVIAGIAALFGVHDL